MIVLTWLILQVADFVGVLYERYYQWSVLRLVMLYLVLMHLPDVSPCFLYQTKHRWLRFLLTCLKLPKRDESLQCSKSKFTHHWYVHFTHGTLHHCLSSAKKIRACYPKRSTFYDPGTAKFVQRLTHAWDALNWKL
jgi:hypothetical protein